MQSNILMSERKRTGFWIVNVEWNHHGGQKGKAYESQKEAREAARKYFEGQITIASNEANESLIDHDNEEEGFYAFAFMFDYASCLCVHTREQ